MAKGAADLSCRSDFEPFVGRVCHSEGAPASPLLLDRIEVGAPAPAPFPEPFALIFRGPKPGELLAEGLHRLRIHEGPVCDLYLIPIHTPRPDRQEYQCVFS